MRTYMIYLLGIVMITMAMDCKPGPDIVIDRGENYYPLADGKFLEYRIDSIIFDDGASGGIESDTFRSIVRELYTKPFLDTNGDTIYELHRFWKPFDSEEELMLTNIWSASKNIFEAIRVEGNLRFQIFKFPFEENKRWRVNTYFDEQIAVPIGTEELEMYEFWDSKVLAFDHADDVGTFTFPEGNVATVQHADNDDGIFLREVTEKYVRDVGLVFREMAIIDSKCLSNPIDCDGLTWDEKGSKGFRLTQTLIDFN